MDRLTRSLRDLVTLLEDLDHVGVAFRSATEPFDTSTAMGRMLVQMLGMLAQFTVISTPHEAAKSPQPGSLPEGAWSGETASRFPRADGR
jgi:hypothetical protein